MTSEGGNGILNVETGFFPLAFILFFIKPHLEVDGVDITLPGWGISTQELSAGPHQVSVYFPYLFPKRAGVASTKLTVPAGGQVSLKYRAPIFVFQPGKLTVPGPPAS